MIILFALLAISMLVSMRVKVKTIDEQYMSRENTQAIKGIFIIIVFMSHVRSYAAFDSTIDLYVIKVIDYLGQLMVAMFLFYSGYGVHEAIKKKGIDYVKAIPKNRVLKTFLHFLLAIILFLIVNLVLGIKYSWKEILLAPTGWTSIGNSNWYMFAIFTLYIITFISFYIFKNKKLLAFVLMAILSIVYIFVVRKLQGGWWCDTYLCYLAGMLYSLNKVRIDALFVKIKNSGYMVAAIFIVLIYFAVSRYRHDDIMIYNITAILFCMTLVVLSMKFSFKSKILSWCGQNLFWLYILQRIPMIVLKHMNVQMVNEYVFICLCAILTVVLSIIMEKVVKCMRKYTTLV